MIPQNYGTTAWPAQNMYSGGQMNTSVPMQQPQQTQQNGGFMTIFVNDENEVNNYPVAAGLTVLLISFDRKKFWLKGTDTSGVPRQLRTFSFEETTPVASQNQNGSEISREEFNALNEKLNKLIAELGGTKNE